MFRSEDEYYKHLEYGERQLENFNSDIEPIVNRIAEEIERIRDIAKGYPDFDMDAEWKAQIKDLI